MTEIRSNGGRAFFGRSSGGNASTAHNQEGSGRGHRENTAAQRMDSIYLLFNLVAPVGAGRCLRCLCGVGAEGAGGGVALNHPPGIYELVTGKSSSRAAQ